MDNWLDVFLTISAEEFEEMVKAGAKRYGIIYGCDSI